MDCTQPTKQDKKARDFLDYVYHIAGLIKAYRQADYDRVNSLATKYLIEAVTEANNKNLKRFLYLSSLAAVGPAEDINGVNEESPCRPVSHYGKSKLKGELIVRQYKDILPVTILRPPPVYGPRDTGLLFFFQITSRGIKPQFCARKYISLLYIDDLVDAIILSAENSRSIGQVYFVANTECYSINSIIDIISKVINNGNVITLRIGDWAVRGFAGLYEGACYLFGLEPSIINNQKAIELSQNYWTCQSEKIKIDIGFKPKSLLEKGIQETADWYLRNKWI